MNIGALVFISTTMLSGLSGDGAEEHVCIQQKIQMAASVFRTLRVYGSEQVEQVSGYRHLQSA